jgi:crotonobetaine/carnitine-CoA ligase
MAALPDLRRRTVDAVLDAALAAHPDKLALREPGRELTYAQAVEQALAVGGGFDMPQGDAVLLMLDNHLDFVLTWLGLALSGRVEVPVNTAYKGRMLAHVVNDSGAAAIVVEEAYCERLAAVAGELDRLRTVVVRGGDGAALRGVGLRVLPFGELLTGPPADRRPAAPSDTLAIMYTSGTTGASKGVIVPQAHAYGYCSPAAYGAAGHDDASLVTLPLFHIGGQWAGVYNALIAGGTAVVVPRFSAGAFWDDAHRYGCTYALLLGAMADFLYRRPPAPEDADVTMRRVLMVPVIAEVDEFAARFGVEVATAYGLTEGSTPLCAPFGRARPKACGWPRDGFEVRLVDDADLEVPRGQVGELVLRARDAWSLMAGYVGRPEATMEAWRNLWLHTGDAMYEDEDGQLVFVDRKNDAIRRRGENVSSFEVEAAILEHPAVAQAAVVAVGSAHTEDEIKAVVVPAQGAALDPADLVRFLVDRLPYFMVPRYVEFAGDLPRTPTEKVRKQVLRDAGLTAETWDREAAGIVVTRGS